MSTLKQYREECLNRVEDPDGFGRVENVASGTATTVVVSALAVGTLAVTKFQNKWLYRPDAANAADRVRMCSTFAPATGTLTHAGANYIVNPASTENVEILEYEPRRFNSAVNLALQRLRKRDVEIIPTNGADKYWLGQFSWVNEPGDVELVKYAPRPILSRNSHFSKWSVATPNTAAITAVPDSFTAYGATATYARITTNTYRPGQYGVQSVAPGGNVVGLSQTVGLLSDGITGDNLASKIVTVYGIGRATAATTLRVWYSDDGGTTKQFSAYHSGNSINNEMSLQVTVAAAASNPTFGYEHVASSTVQMSKLLLMLGALSDGVRKDSYTAIEIPKTWDESAGPGALVLRVPTAYSLGAQIEVHSKRSYATQSAPLLVAETDTADAPLAQIAVGALYLLYRGLAAQKGVDVTQFKVEEDRWLRRYADLAGKHYAAEWGSYGAKWPPPMLTPFPVAVR